MKIEVGKFYKTRSGKKAYVLADYISPFAEIRDYIEKYIIHIQGDFYPEFFFPDGRYMAVNGEHGNDIISEWKEPIKVSGWINVYGNEYDFGTLFPSKEIADINSYSKGRTTCVYVEGVEKCS